MSFNANFISAKDAADLIDDGSTLCTVGMTLISASESILKQIETKYITTGHPKDITYVHSAGQCDRVRGNQHLAHKGLVKKIIGSHWGLAPKWMEMISNNDVEAYCLPQGQMTHLYRAMAAGKPGELSKVGLGTFIDPRIEGGKMNDYTKMLPDITKIIELDGNEYMFYKEIPLDFVIIRGTSCDEIGNLSTSEEAMMLEIMPAVLAAKRYGGKVIAQVKHVVQKGTLHPKDVIVPGVFIDAIVVCDNPEEDHRQTSSWFFDPAYCGNIRESQSKNTPLPLTIRKAIGRRAVMEMYDGCVVNLGTGIPNDVVGAIVEEEEVNENIMITVESGIYGGVQAGGIDFGIGKNLWAMIEHDVQMDYYNGAGVDITFMGAGEIDECGNVNATKLGSKCTGAGGFIDITQNAKHVVFCSTFTTGGLDVEFVEGNVVIRSEGKIKKMVKRVNQISYNGKYAQKTNQRMHFVTERAVFELCKDGLVLTEIAPGIDLERDILNQMDFKPIISDKLMVMPKSIFTDEKYGLKDFILRNKS